MRSYLPLKEAALVTFLGNFADKVTASPGQYGLSPSQAEAIRSATDTYAAAHALAFRRATRTLVQVAGKNAARKAALDLVRPYAQLIKANPAISRELKIGLGLNHSGGGRSPIAAPTARPALLVMAVAPRRHLLRYTTPGMEGHGRAGGKPAGAIGLQVFCHVGQTAPAEPLDARFLRFLSRPSCTVDFPGEQVGQTAFYYARWQTATGETGPWSLVTSLTVAG